MRVRNSSTGVEETVRPASPFSTERLLVGMFSIAESALRGALAKVRGRRLRKDRVLIQPLEMIDGGLSEVEERVLLELAAGAGCGKAVVWVGEELSDQAVRAKLGAP